ncbi:acetyl-CoA-benzylalcohol acetyltransferase-like [Quercus robur]|uniref:acetyl-CoA-benzylalcohol acetyltransferase-like n=1 Tax=Quercus robur TaxID=38942 RepID=UPI00216234E9|nr:acetyl-CoA-benzylalcohol acetyltransferase-like [Quercus robur]
MEVQILSRKLIKPTTPTPPHLRSYKTSSLDQLAPPAYVPFILYYVANGDKNEIDERSKRLEKSLSEILTLYYPLAGRYIRDKQLVDCNDEGAEYLEAQVSGKLAQVLQGELKPELLNSLVPNVMPSETTPLAFVQVNMFECGGLAIALECAHFIIDGITATTFFNAWAKACKAEGINEVIHPRFDLASFFPPRENIMPMKPPKMPGPGANPIITKRFVFNKEAISSLKAIAKGGACDSETSTKRQPSRVVAVTTLIWKALIAVAKARRGHLRASILSHSLNLRGKTALPIPDNSFGNFYMVANARFGGNNESKFELHDLVDALDDSIRNTLDDCMKAQTGDDLVSMMTKSLREVGEERERGETDIYMFSSWCRFPFYEADFGWGNPAWMSIVAIPMEMIGMFDTKDGDGIEAWVSLHEEAMLMFQNYPEIKAFTSQI